ncbi:MAG: hypothetical protein CVU89_08535 [Firmicutes bacterium HGW-Firmicutes-14]|jgi:4-hydroxy-3-polyprenylbenzoate decarboxylase|nr:MAG: hypothetical protein CVU89_08535 [Firmicutes bacterium HGW-Firmicutes-14]
MKRIVLAISGASGAIYGIRLLEELCEKGVEVHLVISGWAKTTIAAETDYTVDQVIGMAAKFYEEGQQGASVSSGSFRHDGMVIAPCSMKTLAGIACGYAENLLVRAADVTLKEQRRLILMPREMPLTAIHLENMLKLARLGAVIMPPVPAFYNNPRSLDDIVNHTVSRVLDHLGIENTLSRRWEGKI